MEFLGHFLLLRRPSLSSLGHKLLQSDAESRALRLNAFRAHENIFAISLRHFGHGSGRSGKFYEGGAARIHAVTRGEREGREELR